MAFKGGISRLSEIIVDMFKTADSGKRIEIDSALRNEIRWFSGAPFEVGPGKILSSWRSYFPTFPINAYYLSLAAPTTSDTDPISTGDPLGIAPTAGHRGTIAIGTQKPNGITATTFIGLNADDVYINGGPVVTGRVLDRQLHAPVVPASDVFNTGAWQEIYKVLGIAVPSDARTALVRVSTRARATINAAGYWRLRVSDYDLGLRLVDYAVLHNYGDQYTDMSANFVALVPVDKLSTFDIRVDGTADPGGGGLFTRYGSISVTFYG